jgi:hypothetical protein
MLQDGPVATALRSLWTRDGIPVRAARTAARHRRRDADD